MEGPCGWEAPEEAVWVGEDVAESAGDESLEVEAEPSTEVDLPACRRGRAYQFQGLEAKDPSSGSGRVRVGRPSEAGIGETRDGGH